MGLANNSIYNIAWFQVVWWGMVYSQKMAIYAALAFIVIHFLLMKGDRLIELLYSLGVVILGVSMDTLFNHFGVLDLNPGYEHQLYPPIWLVVLWGAFSCTLRFSLKKITNNLILAIPLGGLGGAASYIAGKKLGMIDYYLPELQVGIVLVATWACLFALFSVLSHQLEYIESKPKRSVTRL